MAKPVYLILENGMVFDGEAFGASGEATGELVFTTNMTGYNETLTCPDYHGQLVLQTFPLSGACGIIPEDFESGSFGPAAYIVKFPCETPSNFRSKGALGAFMRKRGIIGMCNTDTRRIMKVIRENGEMNARITETMPAGAELEEIKAYKPQGFASPSGVKEKTIYKSGTGRFTVALIDLGAPESVRRELLERGCDILAFPAESAAGQITAARPDGLVLAGCSGAMEALPQTEASVKTLMSSGTPVCGVSMGHLLLARAAGFAVYRLKRGHRGSNHPVKDTKSGRIYITSQNHGYAVSSESIDQKIARESLVNVNDGTCEGIVYKNALAYSAQFAPAAGGERDSAFSFDRLIRHMEERKNASR